MGNETVLVQILELKQMGIKDLLKKYAALFGDTRHTYNNAEYLRKKIANKLQEQAYRGLSEPAKSKLDQIIGLYDPINNKLLRKVKPDKQKPIKGARDRRLPIPGSLITKTYKGTEINIKTLEKGFEYNDKTYRTLSSVANAITGDHWNGYLFFGL